METIKKITSKKNQAKALLTLREVIGTTILAALALAFVAEHLGQLQPKYAWIAAAVFVGLVLFFTKKK